MTASGPATLPPALTVAPGQKLVVGHKDAHINDRDELRSIWEYTAGVGRVTSAILQDAVDNYDYVKLPSALFGVVSLNAKITIPDGVTIEGTGGTIVEWTGAASGVIFERTSGTFAPSGISIRNLTIRSSVAGVTGIRIVNGGFERFENIFFAGIKQHFLIDRGMMPTVRNITVGPYGTNPPGGSWFGSTDQTDYLYHPDIDGFHNYTNDPAPGDGNPDSIAVLTFSRIAAGDASHLELFAPNRIGVLVTNDSQGVKLTDSVMTGVTRGVVLSAYSVWTLTVDATGGTYTILFNGETTGAIAENAAASAVQSALEALTSVAGGGVDVVVTGSAGGPYTITWQESGAFGSTNLPRPSTNSASLTGGTHTATITADFPTFTTIDTFDIDQASVFCIDLNAGAQTKINDCFLTNSNQGIDISPYGGVARTHIYNSGFENMTFNGVVGQAGAGSIKMLGCHFIGMGAGGSGGCFVLGAGASDGILLAVNDMREANLHGTIVDTATSGTERYYLDNPGADPAITTMTGCVVRTAAILQTDGIVRVKKTAVGSPPSNPPSGYGSIWIADDNKAYINTGSDNRPILDTDLITAAGQLIYGTADETVAALAIGTAHQELAVNAGATAPTWADGVRKVLTTAGDMVYATAAATLARLGIGANKTMLTSNGSAPSWSASPTLSGTLSVETDTRSAKFSDTTSTNMNLRMRDLGVMNNNTTASLLGISGSSTGTATVVIVVNDLGNVAIFLTAGVGTSTVEILDPAAAFSITAGTGGTNVYWSAGNTRYEIQNFTGSARQYWVHILTRG